MPELSRDNETIITPWEVKGKLEYEKIIQQFGTSPLTEGLIKRFKKLAGGNLHVMLRRKLFFTHRDFDLVINHYEKGGEVVLYTGRGPSGPIHLGHYVPWIFTKYLQDVFKAKLYFQITDDEKFLYHREYRLKDVQKFTNDNILDIIAAGFDPHKTKIIIDIRDINVLYKIAVKVAKHVTFSTVKAVFGFQHSTNIGLIFFPAVQAAPCFLEEEITGENVLTLIPCAIDQDPYFRVARDIAAKLGYNKPSTLYSKFFPGLLAGGKMSSSEPESAIYMTDTSETIKRKIWNAFTGGQPTVEEQRLKGGNPDICPIFHYLYFLFEEDDHKIRQQEMDCRSGNLLCGEHKLYLIKKLVNFMEKHRKRREKARDLVDKFLL